MRKLLILGLFLFIGIGIQAQDPEYGIASYYSDAFHGRSTANGELYHKDKRTAAHKDLPFGTVIKVTRLDNKKSVQVVVNDRGPYIKGRIVDLSKAAAKELDLIQAGKARVKLEVLQRGEEALVAKSAPIPDLSSLRSGSSKADTEEAIPTPASTEENAERIVPKSYEKTPVTEQPKIVVPDLKVSSPKPAEKTKKAAPVEKAPTADKTTAKGVATMSKASLVKGSDYQTYDLYKIQLMRPSKTGFGVQVASMSNYDNALKQVAELQEKWFNNILISVEKGKDGNPLYKLILGPFPDRSTADSYKTDLKKKKKINGFVVDLSTL